MPSLEFERGAHHLAVFVSEPSRIERSRRRIRQLGDRLHTKVPSRSEPHGLRLDHPRNVAVCQAKQQRRVTVDIRRLNYGPTEGRTFIPEASRCEELLQATSLVLCHV